MITKNMIIRSTFNICILPICKFMALGKPQNIITKKLNRSLAFYPKILNVTYCFQYYYIIFPKKCNFFRNVISYINLMFLFLRISFHKTYFSLYIPLQVLLKIVVLFHQNLLHSQKQYQS